MQTTATVSAARVRCQIWLQRVAVEAVPRNPGEARDDVRRLPAGEARGDELGDRSCGCTFLLRRCLRRAEHERDLALDLATEPFGQLGQRPDRDLLEPLGQLSADSRLPLGAHARENT